MWFKLIRGRNYGDYFDVYKDSNGKPFLRNSKKHISVTHFDGWTLVVVSKRPVGIDVQRMGKIDGLLWDSLDVRRGKQVSVFKEWTRREAYIKKREFEARADF